MSVEIPTMPAPKQDDLRQLALRVGTDLPQAYIDFVSRHDGATPESNSFEVGADNASGVRQFISVTEAPSVLTDVEGFPAGMVPVADDDCGNFIYIDPADGGVFFWDHEIDGPDLRVASDLPTFLGQLAPFDASKVKLAPGQVRRVWVNPNFKPEF
jgi:hypothetical protein